VSGFWYYNAPRGAIKRISGNLRHRFDFEGKSIGENEAGE
jgi:hypothetical protein